MNKKIFIFVTKKSALLVTCSVFIIIITSLLFVRFISIKSHSSNLLAKKTIVIDPGHGGIDSGTHYRETILEKDINLKAGLMLKEKMLSANANIIMTREIDDSLDDHIKNGSRHREDLNARVKIINQNNADIFISIHCNYIENNPGTLGPVVFYHSSSTKSKYLAECIQEALNNLSAYKDYQKAKHSACPGQYVLLRETSSPGVIIEMGFLSNQTDRDLLQNEKHLQEIVQQICKGVENYFYGIENNLLELESE